MCYSRWLGDTLLRWISEMRNEGMLYIKTQKVNAMIALRDGEIRKVIDGKVQQTKSYKKGDFIVVGSAHKTGASEGRYPIAALDFTTRYNQSRPEPASDAELASEGFHLYPPIGKIWAHELTEEEVKHHFPGGAFLGKWGGLNHVKPGDYLVLPFPNATEIYAIGVDLFEQTYAPYLHVPTQVHDNIVYIGERGKEHARHPPVAVLSCAG